MLLVIDVGNTNTVLGLYQGDTLQGQWRVGTNNYRTGDELRILFTMLLRGEGVDPSSIDGCCVSSVVPQLNMALQEVSRAAFGVAPLMVGPGVKTGLQLQCDNPKEVGADRIVNAVGALEEHEGDLIVIDFGTALTFDAVTARAEWCGGAIVPGVQLSAEALFEHCAKLPRVEISRPACAIGRDTVTNIRSGLTYGYAGLVDGLVRKFKEEMGGSPTVIATGGISGLMAEFCAGIDVVDPLLTLKGLKAVYHKNPRPGT